jgi:ParB/RepB/Spo0J family partition protein
MNNILIPAIMLLGDVIRERQIREETGLTDECEEDVQLRESIRINGILNPLIVHEATKVLICGHRRYRQAVILGLKEVPVRLFRGETTPTTRLTLQFAENFGRVDMTPYEKAMACIELAKLNPTWNYRQIGAVLGVKDAMVLQYLSVADCPPAVVEELRLKKLTIGHCYAYSRLPEDARQAVLAKGIINVSRDDIARAARGQRTSDADKTAVPQKRVVVTLPTGETLTFAGGSAKTLAQWADLGAQGVKLMRIAIAEGIDDCKVFSSVAKTKAKTYGVV